MVGTVLGAAVLLLVVGGLVFALVRGRHRLALSIGLGLVVVLLDHQLGLVAVGRTETSTQSHREMSSATSETVSVQELRDFRAGVSCPEEAREVCAKLDAPSDTQLRITSFQMETGFCGLPLGSTVSGTAKLEASVAWLRRGVSRTMKLQPSVDATTQALGLYSCRSIRQHLVAEVAASLSREIAKEVPDTPAFERPLQIESLASGHGQICVVLVDQSVRCLSHSGVVSAPPGLRAREIALGEHVVCGFALDDDLTCARWEGGNIAPKPGKVLCRGLPKLTSLFMAGEDAMCGVDPLLRGACFALPTKESDCATVARAFEAAHEKVREVVRVTDETCVLGAGGEVSCGAARIPAEMRRDQRATRGLGALLGTLGSDGTVRLAAPQKSGEPRVLSSMPFGAAATRFDARTASACVVAGGHVRCAGREFGDPLPSDPLPDVADAVDVAMEGELVCALTAKGTLACVDTSNRARAELAKGGFIPFR